MPTYFVKVKSAGARRAALERQPVEFAVPPPTLRALLREWVTREVARAIAAPAGGTPLKYLMPAADGRPPASLEADAERGKVSFGARYAEVRVDPDRAVEAALLAFADGLFRVFVRDAEATDLDAPLSLVDGDEIVFLRLVMLTGL